MQEAEVVLGALRERGEKGLPFTRTRSRTRHKSLESPVR
jgi:hypothetical protein